MKPVRLRDLFELVRLPNVFTAPADVAMGLAAAGAAWEPKFAWLLGASALAYAGGMALNDACDAELDAKERPNRPIPSGRISRVTAQAIATLCFAGTLFSAWRVGIPSLIAASALVAMIVIYDLFAKRTSFGPLVMASCRLLDAGLGISVGAIGLHALGPAAILFSWVFVITGVSKFETMEAPVRAVREAAMSFAFLVGLSALVLIQRGGADGLPFLALLAWWMSAPLRAAMSEPSGPRIIGVIKASVLGIIFLDAAYAGGAWGVMAGLAVAALFAPAYYLGRRFASA
jgi:4-hydroxybenzoate polyprenyltransferase